MKTFVQNAAIIIFSALVSGCASTGVKVKLLDQPFMQTLNENGKATIANYGSGHAVSGYVSSEYGAWKTSSGQRATPTTWIISKVSMDWLDEKCLAAIEDVLVSDHALHYVARLEAGLPTSWANSPREDKKFPLNIWAEWEDFYKLNENYVQLRDKHGITAFIKIKLTYSVAVGWRKPPRLQVDWDVVNVDGQSKIKIITFETAAVGQEIFVDTQDPKYADDYITLARQNATQFVNLLAKQNVNGGKN